MKSLAIFISGRGSNMQAIVTACKDGILKGLAQPILVFSNKEEAAGLAYAQKAGIPTEVIISKGKDRKTFDQEVVKMLHQYQPDYIILAGYMRILSSYFIQQFPNKIINIHPADTTLHQGLDGYNWAFDKKLTTTKITVHFVDEGLDTGRIIKQEVVDLSGVSSLEDVEQRGLAVEHKVYSQALKEIILDHS